MDSLGWGRVGEMPVGNYKIWVSELRHRGCWLGDIRVEHGVTDTVRVRLPYSGSSSVGMGEGVPVSREICAETVHSGKRFAVAVEVDSIPGDTPLASAVWGGDDISEFVTHVKSLSITAGTARVAIALSAYADLGFPRVVEFRPYSKGLCFVIVGGNESVGHGYEARYFVEGGVLRRRRVVAKAFPDQLWEETRYSVPGDLD